MRRGNTLTYLHGDHLGSAALTTNASGARVSLMRYTPYGGLRVGGLPTDRQFTGQRHETTLGFYDYNARQYDPVLGRFIQADTIIPDPANPQSLNRYAYVLNNPLRYTDPSGHFEIDEIDRYLEHSLGITDAKERERIINRWRTDKSGWWAIIGPGGANYGDILDGTKLNPLGRPGNRVHGQFRRDRQNNTFTFTSEEFSLEMPGNWGAWDIRTSNSLIKFHNETKDVIWKRYNVDRDEWIYQGGTGYAANNGSIEGWTGSRFFVT